VLFPTLPPDRSDTSIIFFLGKEENKKPPPQGGWGEKERFSLSWGWGKKVPEAEFMWAGGYGKKNLG
jgi:hypothetical protein